MPIKPELADDIAVRFQNMRQELVSRASDAAGLPPLVLDAQELAELGTEQAIADKRKKLEKAAIPALRRAIAMALKDDDSGSADVILTGLDVTTGGAPDPQDNLRVNFFLTNPELLAALTPLREIVRIYQAAARITANQVTKQKTVRDIMDLVLGAASGRLT